MKNELTERAAGARSGRAFGAEFARACALGAVLSMAVGCGGKSGDGAASASPDTKSSGAKSAGAGKTAGSAGPGASGASSTGAVAGGKPRVAYEMNGADVCLDGDPPSDASHMISADETNWPNGSTIVVGFLDGQPEWIENVVEAANEWTQYANLTFEWHKDPNDIPKNADELVTFSAKTCGRPSPSWFVRGAGPQSAKAAKRGEFSVCLSAWQPYINHGKLDDAKASALHEFGHVIGLWHEQFNPNLKVTWDKEYLYDWCKKTQNWDKQNCDRQIMMPLDKMMPEYHWRATPFDKDSIMFYGIQDPNWTMERVTFPEPTKLSEMDKKSVAELYPKGSKDPVDPKEASKGYDLETQIKKLGEKDGKAQYIVAVGVAEASDRTKVESVVYVFPSEIADKPVDGDPKHEQFIVQGKVLLDPAARTFTVRARIKMKDGSTAVVDKEFDLSKADGGGDIIKGDGN